MSDWIDVASDEDTGISLMARVQGKVSGSTANITQASLTGISYVITKDGTSVGSGSLTVSAVVFDTLQTDSDWDTDSTGYNFRWDVDDDVFTTPGVYLAVVTFDPVSGSNFKVKWRVTCKGDETD